MNLRAYEAPVTEDQKPDRSSDETEAKVIQLIQLQRSPLSRHLEAIRKIKLANQPAEKKPL